MKSEGSETDPIPNESNPRAGGDDAANFFGADDDDWGTGFSYLGFRDEPLDEAADEDENLVPIVLPEPPVAKAKTGKAKKPKVAETWHPELDKAMEVVVAEPEDKETAEVDLTTEVDPEPEPVLNLDPEPAADTEAVGDPELSFDLEPEPETPPDPEADPEPVQPIVFPEAETAAESPQIELLSTIPAPPAWPGKAVKTRRRKPVLPALALVAVLLAFGGGYLLGVNKEPSLADGLGLQHSADSAPQIVETYLEALAKGDADAARKIAGASSSEVLLSSEVLRRSNEKAPITNVSVGEGVVDGDEIAVPAKFKVGDTAIDRTFSLRNTSAGWQLYDGLVAVSVPSLAGYGALFNETVLDSAETRVFPGVYAVGLSDADFELNVGTDADAMLIASPEQAVALRDLQPRLTPESTARYTEMVRSSLDECLAQTSLTTPCGLDVSAKLKDGSTPIDGTVERTLDSEGSAALDALVVQLDSESPGTVFSIPNVQVKTRLEAENSGSRVSGELLYGGQLLSPHVDFSEDSPVVVWK